MMYYQSINCKYCQKNFCVIQCISTPRRNRGTCRKRNGASSGRERSRQKIVCRPSSNYTRDCFVVFARTVAAQSQVHEPTRKIVRITHSMRACRCVPALSRTHTISQTIPIKRAGNTRILVLFVPCTFREFRNFSLDIQRATKIFLSCKNSELHEIL